MCVFKTENVAAPAGEERCRILHFCRWTHATMLVQTMLQFLLSTLGGGLV